MKRIIMAATCSACFFATAACDTILGSSELQPPLPGNPPILSQPYDMLIQGEPNLNLITVKGGYYVWTDGNSWHVWVARTDAQPRNFPYDFFTGAIRVEGGYITNVETPSIRPPDDIRLEQGSIFYRLEVQREVKGINFRVRPILSECCITFDLQVNGLASAEYIRLGRGMVTPDTAPIKMCFGP